MLEDEVHTEMVSVHSVHSGDSPRLAGVNSEHTRVLAETDAVLPPILVHRSSMRVIDGMHRLSAAMLNGQELIEVRFFDGSEEDAFVLAVQGNIAHGLPLSMADRRAAAVRIIVTHPAWSDRAVAKIAGIAPGTVAVLRDKSHSRVSAPQERIGLDGRVRPLTGAVGRRIAAEIAERNPDASIRDIASAAGVSVGTAHDVRQRVRRGKAPVAGGAESLGAGSGELGQRRAGQSAERDRLELIEKLRKDPSLRLTDSGRALLRWLLPLAAGVAGWRKAAEAVQPHSTYLLAKLARGCAEELLEFARQMEKVPERSASCGQ